MKKIHRSIRWIGFVGVLKSIAALITISTLARFADKSQIGDVAILSSYIGPLATIGDFGISGVIYSNDLNSKKRGNISHTLGIGAGFLSSICSLVAGLLIYVFSNEINQTKALAIISFGLLFVGINVVQKASLEKQFRFKQVASIEISAVLIGSLITIISALQINAVLAFAIGFSIQSFSAFIAFVLISKSIPISDIRFPNWTETQVCLYGFGGVWISQISSNIDVLAAGFFVNKSQLGVYFLSKEIVLKAGMLISIIFSRLGLPLLYRANMARKRLGKQYLLLVRRNLLLNGCVYLLMLLLGPNIIEILYPKIHSEINVLLIPLIIWAMIKAASNQVGALLVVTSKQKTLVQINIIYLLIQTAFVTLWLLIGDNNLAIANIILGLFGFWLSWTFLVKPIFNYTLCDITRNIIPTYIAFLTAILVAKNCSFRLDSFERSRIPNFSNSILAVGFFTVEGVISFSYIDYLPVGSQTHAQKRINT